MIYDFNKEMVIAAKNEKKSQVEVIIDAYKSRQNINISEDSNYVNLSFDKYVKDLKGNKNGKNSSKNLNQKKISEHKITEKNNVIDAAKEFEKDIMYAISKQEDQNSIKYFYIISFIFLAILLIIYISEIFFMISSYNEFKENLDLIINSIYLKYYTNVAIFSIRETTLFSFDNSIGNISYSIPDNDPDDYKEKIYNISKDAFTSCNSHMEKIIGNGLKLSSDTMNTLTKEAFNITILYDLNKTREVTSTRISSIIQIYSALCNLLQNFNISTASLNLHNFLYNSFNKIATCLNLQMILFINEISGKWANKIYDIIVYSVIYALIYVVMFILVTKGFVTITKKKTSYISVFYGIDLSLIKSSIRKCEFFINKINQNEKSDKLKMIEEENSTIISNSNFNLNNPFNANKTEKKNVGIKKNRNIGNDRRTKQFKIILLIGIIFAVIIFEAILVSVGLLANKFAQNVNYLFHLQRYHINVFEIFNAYRELLFDQNTIINNTNVNDYLTKKEEEFYETNMEDINNIYTLQQEIKGLDKALDDLEKQGFCNSYFAYFSSKEDCEKFVGGKDGILNFGFLFVVNEFVDDIRYGRNLMNDFLNYPLYIGNLSFHDYEEYAKDLNKQLNSSSPVYRLKIFNELMHSRINIRFMNIIMQYIIKEREVSINYILNSIEGGYIIYIIFIIIYAAIVCIIFWLYWIPMIRTLNLEIYKTKNMLTIIPVQILASLPNIRELLNISNKR